MLLQALKAGFFSSLLLVAAAISPLSALAGNYNDQPQVQHTLDAVREQVSVFIPPQFNRFQHAFSHIFSGGYSAGYYSYKWAEVLSADAFSLFEENGIFDKDTAGKFKEHILSKGGTEKPMTLYKKFRGKEPNADALLKRAGLLT